MQGFLFYTNGNYCTIKDIQKKGIICYISFLSIQVYNRWNK